MWLFIGCRFYITWFNFIFGIFSLKTLKFITKAIAVGVAVPVAFGFIMLLPNTHTNGKPVMISKTLQ